MSRHALGTIGYSYSDCLPLRWISVHRRRDTSPLLLPQSARKISRKFTCRRALAVQTSVQNLKSTGGATARQRAREYARVRARTRGRSKSSTDGTYKKKLLLLDKPCTRTRTLYCTRCTFVRKYFRKYNVLSYEDTVRVRVRVQ